MCVRRSPHGLWAFAISLALGLVFAMGVLLEMVSVDPPPESIEQLLSFGTVPVVVAIVALIAAHMTSHRAWYTTVVAGGGIGMAGAVVLVMGLFFPFAVSLGNRYPGGFPGGPGELTVLDVMLVAMLYGALTGVFAGALGVVVKLLVVRGRRNGTRAVS